MHHKTPKKQTFVVVTNFGSCFPVLSMVHGLPILFPHQDFSWLIMVSRGLSSILDWDFPWNTPSNPSSYGTSIEPPHLILLQRRFWIRIPRDHRDGGQRFCLDLCGFGSGSAGAGRPGWRPGGPPVDPGGPGAGNWRVLRYWGMFIDTYVIYMLYYIYSI